ncbi:hypothetical protein [Aestuariispira insulae]|uniref:Uncharacterized protein n=1 Tax=Aestuariispira insulae TaxID=1461337 RepID=A0A3D9HUH5_9PROT|nr:hypothetical protein [Aestuariispira insulae]RED52536.1 hypothetical protein DFP90_102559 [Aestuariispira insulae]
MERSNAEVMRVATQFEAMRRTVSVDPDNADMTRQKGREEFYNSFMGRYGLPGSAKDPAITDLPGLAEAYDLSSMSVREVIALAGDLMKAGMGQGLETSLLGFDFSNLPFAEDPIFHQSPLFFINSTLGLPGRRDRSYDWIMEYEAQLKHLTEEGGDARAIDATRNVLGQLRKLQAERNMYAAMGLDGGDDEDVGQDGFYNQGLLSPALTMLAAEMDR